MEVKVYHCPSCGGSIEDTNSKFCKYCGSKLNFEDENLHKYKIETIDHAKVINETTKAETSKTKLKIYGFILIALLIFIAFSTVVLIFSKSEVVQVMMVGIIGLSFMLTMVILFTLLTNSNH